ncbi:MAG: tetraacyldisaccharide 4'-kinase [Pseudomonadota bacterium]
MRTPAFWYKPKTTLATVLGPLGRLYAAATAMRVRKFNTAYEAPVPVICIGNLNAGGTGKTPTTIALAERLRCRQRKVVILSKGYKGARYGPWVVDPASDTAADVGDEPLMMAAFATTIVAGDRAEGAAMAAAEGAEVILMDDGFQSPAVHKDASIVVVDAGKGFGNGLCIPAGPLREPVADGLARADLVLTVGSAPQQNNFPGPLLPTSNRIQAQLVPLPTGMPWSGLRAVAFAGIGLPDKFFKTLKAAGVTVLAEHSLADHQAVPKALFDRLLRDAQSKNAQLVTTEKDAIKLPPDLRPLVLPFPVRLAIEDWSDIDAIFDRLGL